MTNVGKIGAFTAAELIAKVRALGARARAASKQEATALLPEAEELIRLIREELARDQGALNQKRAEVMGEKAKIDAQFSVTDQQREALQAQEMTQLEQQVEAAKKERGEQGLWTRLTTKDEKSQQAKAESDAKAMEHDQQDARDAQARQAAVASVIAKAQPYEGEAAGTYAALQEVEQLAQHLVNRAAGWGEGSELFTRMRRIVEYGQRANANDLDAKSFMAITAALTGKSIEEMNAIHQELRGINRSLRMGHQLTDVEALATLACGAAAANIHPGQMMDLWCTAVDHARRVGGFSNDEDARAMVVFCAAVTGLAVDYVQTERRSVNVDNFRGQDPEGAGMILLAHTLSRRPIMDLVGVYHSAARVGLPQEERGYMAMAAGLGEKSAEWVVGRFRSLVDYVVSGVPLPSSHEHRREAIREAAAMLTIAAATSPWNDAQLIELFNMTDAFQPRYGAPDFEARGGLVVGAVSKHCKL